MGPRLPGDKGPHRPPEKKSLTHNPFAALAQKLEDAGKPAEEPRLPHPPPPRRRASPAAPGALARGVRPGGTPEPATPDTAAPAESGAEAKQGG